MEWTSISQGIQHVGEKRLHVSEFLAARTQLFVLVVS